MNKHVTRRIPREEIEKQYYYMEMIAQQKGARKAHIRTFGCQMNEHDSEKLSGMLKHMGYELVEDGKSCDLVIFNTCCIRENAEEKVYGHLGAFKGIKKEHPETIVAVCGCMTEQPHVVEEIKKKYKNVDLVFGTHNLHRFPELLYNCLNNNTRIYEISRTDGEVAEGMPISRESNIKAWVTVMYGCDNYCSYCIVPYVRGRERSRKAEDILHEIKELEQSGVKEITLLGQNVNSYGKDLEEETSFAELLALICENTSIPRIRFMTSHPKDLSDELIDAAAKYSSICNHFHLPVQSGSTEILRRMNRRYTRGQYIDLVKRIRSKIPGIALTTDIIVGFPGETEKDFEDTLQLMREIRFDMAYTFIYSKRAGAPAASYPDQVSGEIVKERFDRLLKVQNDISKEINDGYVGKRLPVLIEGVSRTNEDRYTGRTEENKIVNFICRSHSEQELTGAIAEIKIDSAQTWSLEGSL